MDQVQKGQFVKDLKIKDNVEGVFLVKHIALMEAKDGRAYLNVILSDATGDIECRVWVNAESTYQAIEKTAFVKAQGKLNLFQGRPQLVLQNLTKVNPDLVNTNDFVVRAGTPAEKMFEELLAIVADLDDVYIRDLLQNILADPEISRRVKLWPAGKTIHHAYESGLLEHILACCKLGVFLSEFYQVNKNYVIAGCVLHDLCKIYELSSGLSVDYTEEGKLVGHLVKGPELIDRFSYKMGGIPYPLKTHLKHILLSHHGSLEYGSPKVPQTREAYLVHLIDLMDSKMNSLEIAIKADRSMGRWTGMIKHLDRVLYKDPLPFYPQYEEESGEQNFSEPEAPQKDTHRESKPKNKPHNNPVNPELKQSLGGLLKNIKIDN